MTKALHLWDNIDYILRKDTVPYGHKEYAKRLTIVVDISNINRNKLRTNRKKIFQKWDEEQLYGYFNWQTKELLHKITQTW